MLLEQIKGVTINDESFELPVNYWLRADDKGGFEKSIFLSFQLQENWLNFILDIEFLFTEICDIEDLFLFLSNNSIEINNIEELQLKLMLTKSWGKKIIYQNGSNSFCFNCHYDESNNLLLIFNFSGTKQVENVYLHGAWKIK